ncbi:MAG: hypothetical protein JNM56_07870 [Planctomycetia bacterium]|nr:hypothetical protein [Planctomycetia bacterium]
MHDDADDFEDIDPDEVDMVVATLRKLLQEVKSESIQEVLQIARQDIAALAELDDWEDEADEEAA